MSSEPNPPDPRIGRRYAGRFLVEARLGIGSMGTVYRARQLSMDREIALKILSRDLSHELDAEIRFEREMKAMARIRHPNTVEVYDFGTADDGERFLAMELVQGVSLDDVIVDAAPVSAVRAGRIGIQVARALAAARAEGVIHRDLKPENIMLVEQYGSRDVVKVLDFGLARLTDSDETDAGRTARGVTLGSPLYIAPEYVAGDEIDHRADLYALGVILFEMLTGQPPFRGNPREILGLKTKERAPRVNDVAEEPVPRWIDSLVADLLHPDPTMRPQTAELVAELILNGLQLTTVNTPVSDLTPLPTLSQESEDPHTELTGETAEDYRAALRSRTPRPQRERTPAPTSDRAPSLEPARSLSSAPERAVRAGGTAIDEEERLTRSLTLAALAAAIVTLALMATLAWLVMRTEHRRVPPPPPPAAAEQAP